MKTKKCTSNNREKKQMEKGMFNFLQLRTSYLAIMSSSFTNFSLLNENAIISFTISINSFTN